MKTITKKLIPLLLTAVFAFGLFGFLSVTSSKAAPQPVNAEVPVGFTGIDISELGDKTITDNDNAKGWSYTHRHLGVPAILNLNNANGRFYLTGENSDLRVIINTQAGPVCELVLDNVKITTLADANVKFFLRTYTSCNITLVGDNHITSENGGITIFNGSRVVIKGDGTLSIQADGKASAEGALNYGSETNNYVAVEESASVILETIGTAAWGGIIIPGAVTGLDEQKIYVGPGASLYAKGASGMRVTHTSSTNVTLEVDGTATFEGNGGINCSGYTYLRIIGEGTVTAIANGSMSQAVSAAGNIRVGDDVTLKITNRSDYEETHIFEAYDAGTTYRWELSNATIIGGKLTDSSITVSIASKQTGTVKRVPRTVTVIVNVAISVTAPVAGEMQVTTATAGGVDYTCGSVSWSPNHFTFTAGYQYTATVTLTAQEDYTFEGGLTGTVTINGNAAVIGNHTSETVTLSYQFAGENHTHSYGTAWKSDATGHWHECSCGDKSGFAEHTAGGWIVDVAATDTEEGSRHRECTVCGYVTTEVIPVGGGNGDGGGKGGLGGGAIAAIVIVCVLAVGVGSFAVFWFVVKKKTFADFAAIFKRK
ncbi:MAG: DUF4815 domain-containing protein [Firmicutes bacterium]|nr:DUF4815 domain-containing protein [Bacillota bacterium]